MCRSFVFLHGINYMSAFQLLSCRQTRTEERFSLKSVVNLTDSHRARNYLISFVPLNWGRK